MALRRLAVAAFIASIVLAAPAGAATLAEAQNAYRGNHVDDAERMFTALAADAAASPADRARALAELARIDWLVRGETDAAGTLLAQMPAIPEKCEAAVLALRIFREAGQPQAPLADAEASRDTCEPRAADALHVGLARTHIAIAATAPQERAAHLAAAATELGAIDSAAGGIPSVASARLSLALAQNDADAAFAAWRAYFWLTEADAPQALTTYVGRAQALFSAGLANSASDENVVTLATLLARAGFIDEARKLAEATSLAARNPDYPDWRKLSRFLAFIDTVRATTLRANREMAAGGRATWFEDEVASETSQMMQDLGLGGDPRDVLAENFGLFGTIGETGGYPSLHGGFLAEDHTLQVEQYGRQGQLRFRVVDNMVSNGFESWLWDGWAEAGGWSNEHGIVQVRSAYTGGPLNALRIARPGPTRERYLARIQQQETQERAALGRDGVALLPATSSRLYLQTVDRLARELGDDDAALIAAYWREEVNYSITLHEGRHSLDGQEPRRLSGADLEYRAKLSQIALSNYPRLGLSAVIDVQIDDSPHGRANRRILEGYRRWMRRHRDEIAGFDRNQPTLSQLDKLTDAQIVAIARSMDPWAR